MCSLVMEWNRPAKYKFKLHQRECGKRKWLDLKGEKYLVYTEKDKRLSSEWVNVKGFDTYRKARELLHVLNGD